MASTSAPQTTSAARSEPDQEPIEIFDKTQSPDQEKTIEELVIMESDHHWRTYALIEGGGTAIVYNMAYIAGVPPQTGTLAITKSPFGEPNPMGANSGVFILTNSKGLSTRVNALFRVRLTEPRMKVADLTKFIIDSRMHDFTFLDARQNTGPGNQAVGCRYWNICLVGELEEAGRVPPGSAEAFVRFIKARSDKLRESIKEEPDQQLRWPTSPGIFNTAKLTYTQVKVAALHREVEKNSAAARGSLP